MPAEEQPIPLEPELSGEVEYLRKRSQAVYGADGGHRTGQDLVGLALSGGGIRSATFNLGILQGLHKIGVFEHIDYLSTVSGGGFIGASLSYLMREQGSGFPFQEDNWPLTSYLHEHANYLGAKGLGSRTLGLLLRGLVFNFLFILPLILMVALGVFWLYPDLAAPAAEQQPSLTMTQWSLVLWVLTIPLTTVVYQVAKWRHLRKSRLAANAATSSLLDLRGRINQVIANVLLLIPVAVLLDLSTVLVPLYYRRPTLSWLVVLALLGGLLAAATVAWLRVPALAAVGGLLLYVPLLYMIAWLGSPDRMAWLDGGVRYLGYQLAPSELTLLALAIALVFYILLFATGDMNISSMHGFYRDALSRAFLVEASSPARHGERVSYEPVGDVPLSSINRDGSAAPYHLFNAALNLQGNAEDVARGRSSAFFTFSRDTVGSSRTGFCRTADMVAAFPKLNLSAVMAISGAAATAYMGRYTSSLLGLPLTLLNIRLGTWIPNPASVRRAEEQGKKVARWRPGPLLFFRELVGAMHERDSSVYLSDGGHLDNTGIYQLLRRRCRYIIAGDAETDPEHRFDGLIRLIRYARLDLSVVIDLPLESLYLGQNGLSRQHATLARIHYPDGSRGQLLYLKASLTGDEPPTIRGYAAVHRDFPHESTADQFFDEGQFESYRELGEHITLHLRGDRHIASFEHLREWFSEAEDWLTTPRV